MLIGLFIKTVRREWWKAFATLPPFDDGGSLPSSARSLRFSLLRSLQLLQKVSLYQVGGTKFSEYYLLGHSLVQPSIAKMLIKNGWVVPGNAHWVNNIVKYRLSSTGLALERQLEAWWAELTFGQRLRAVLLE